MPSASKALPGGRTRPWEAYTVPRAHVAFSVVGKGLRIVRNVSRYQQLLLNTRRLQQLTLGRFARKWVALPMGGIRAGVQAAGRMGDGVGAGRAVYILAG